VVMQGKTVVITGATSGIGEVAALALARMGARIVAVARSKARGDETLARLRNSAPGIAHTLYVGDLLRLSEMKRLAGEIADAEAQVDVLINNAGAMFGSRRLTEDGLERTFALNHMAYFVLTAGLRERLKAAPAARIINTASDAHRGATLDLDQIQSASGFGGMKAYSHSKLCNILFTRELGRRLHGTAVTANCLHPGFVATRFGDESGGLNLSLRRVRQAVCDITGARGGHDRLSRFRAGGGPDNRAILLPPPPDRPHGGCAGRPRGSRFVAAERGLGRHQGMTDAQVESDDGCRASIAAQRGCER
jgi:retinol dehydrogenase 12